MMHGRQNIKFCFLCYCVCSVPRFVYFVLSYLSFCIFFVLYLFLVFSFSYTFISTLCFLFSFFHFIPLYIFMFSFRTYLLAPAASCLFHIVRPIHHHVPVLRIGLYSPRRTHGFIGRLLCLLWARGRWLTSTGTIIHRAGFETAILRVTSYCHT